MPGSSANLGPGFDCMAAAVSLKLELEVIETGHFAVESELPIAKGRDNLCVRAFESLHAADAFDVSHQLGDPTGRRPGLQRGGDRGRCDGGRPSF